MKNNKEFKRYKLQNCTNKKKLLLFLFLGFIILPFVGHAQSELNGRICFHFIDQYGFSVEPEVEIMDSEGNLFKLSKDYCFDYFTPFNIEINSNNHYRYQKIYHTSIPKTDTIILNNIANSIRFFIKSKTPILTNENEKHLKDFFSNDKYHFTSLSLEIYIGKYDMSDFQRTITQIYELYLGNFLHRKFNNSVDFSIYFKNNNIDDVLYLFDDNDNLDNVFYLFHGEVYKIKTMNSKVINNRNLNSASGKTCTKRN